MKQHLWFERAQEDGASAGGRPACSQPGTHSSRVLCTRLAEISERKAGAWRAFQAVCTWQARDGS